MEIKATLQPGQKGTRQLLKTYGDQLVCVRYRYDRRRQKRLKTVELIIDERDWLPGIRITPDKRVHVQIGYGEQQLREAVKSAGGFWDPKQKAWVLPYSAVIELGLEKRVVDDIGF